MAQARAYLRSLALAHADVGEILCRLNEILTVEGSEKEFVTQILVRVDPDARTLVFANAGHPAGILIDRTGQIREELESCGPPLGIFTDRAYPASRAIQLEHGDFVVLYTDGITECSGPDESEFGTERVIELAKSHRRDPARKILEAIYERAIAAIPPARSWRPSTTPPVAFGRLLPRTTT
jgi:sigma-B regulation protein RsbU (phosphoserine phosphatase)